ncbi:MAG: serine/threonine-protein kinase [Verrucomicrobiales bacterium]|nr:serine/threonine-protein kinase [Verrucomicrobiales bacterium]
MNPSGSNPDPPIPYLSSGIWSSVATRNWNPPSLEALSLLLPAFEILEIIGKGGMGVVYRGIQKSLERPVAIKLLPAELGRDLEFKERFRREARAMAMLNHPNIVSIHDYGETECGHVYFVMEFVDGCDLHQHAKNGQLDTNGAMNIMVQVCDALTYAHANNIIHRDIKPGNVFLTSEGIVKVGDFGLAKLLRPEMSDPAYSELLNLTLTGVTMGTPSYMAPEQLEQGESIDHRADLYSLGVLFYEILTGNLPQGAVRAPSEITSFKPDARLDPIVFRSMETDRGHRYQTASEFREAIEAVQRQPVVKAASIVEEKRNRFPLTALIIGGISVCLITAGILFFLPKTSPPTPVVNHTVPIENSSKGKLVFSGRVQGHPAKIPDEWKEQRFDWIHPNHRGGILVASEKIGVQFLTRQSIRVVQKSYCKKRNTNPTWAGTELTIGNQLNWKFKDKEHGTFMEVIDFNCGGGTESFTVSVMTVLLKTGELKLVVPNSELNWDFESWAKTNRFQDVEISIHYGLAMEIFCLTKSGELIAFNRDGIVKLPPEISYGVVEVSIGGTSRGRIAIVKENGDIYELTKGKVVELGANRYQKGWIKAPHDLFPSKHPVHFFYGGHGRTVQFSDGTWAAWTGDIGFEKPVFREITDHGPLSDLRILNNPKFNCLFVIGIQ